jgi:hypothetical protein
MSRPYFAAARSFPLVLVCAALSVLPLSCGSPPRDGGGSRGSDPLWFGYVDTTRALWYASADPLSAVPRARVAITDAGGTQQSGSAVLIRF